MPLWQISVKRNVYRAVFDTNVLLSGGTASPSPASQLIDQWRGGAFVLVISPQLLEEVQEVLQRPEIRQITGLTEQETTTYISEIAQRAYVTAGTYEVARLTTDPDDNMILACALEGNASHIVTKDKKSLLPLKQYHGIRIVQPHQFLDLLTR
jgi:uncharacterized protein